MPVLVKDGKPISSVGGSGVGGGGNTGTNEGHHHPDTGGHHGDHDIVGSAGVVNPGAGAGGACGRRAARWGSPSGRACAA